MEKKVVFFDVDGTLVDYVSGMKYVPDSTKRAIKKIKKDGNLAVLATGRPKSFLSDEIKNLEFDAYITSNGAYIEKDNRVIYNRIIDRITLNKAVEIFEKENIEFILEGQQYSYCTNLNSNNIKNFLKKFFISKKNITDKWKLEEVIVNKIVIFIVKEKQLNICMELLGDKFNFMKHTGETSYDVYFKDCTKADGIKKLLEHINIDLENTYAFGDGINDIEMFEIVKYGIAMENANEKLKKVAYYVTNDVFSHGIYNGLKTLKVI